MVIGSKGFTEQYVLAAALTEHLERQGMAVDSRTSLGSTVLLDALSAGEVHVAVDYSGTLWNTALGRDDQPGREVVLRTLTESLPRSHGIRVVGALGFENAYALAVRSADAEALGWSTVGDLPSASLVFGSDLEFLARPEWVKLKAQHSLRFADVRSFDATFLYEAVASGSVDVITAYTTDPRLETFELQLLEDELGILPPYDAVLLVSDKAPHGVEEALRPLLGTIDLERMRGANRAVDVNGWSVARAGELLVP